MSLIQNELINLFSSIDQTFADVSENYPDQVKCGRGCDDCCSAVFDMSLVEALALGSMFLEVRGDAVKQVQQKAAVALSEWEKIKKKTSAGLAKERVECPLLNNDGLCLCYEARPVNCRTYGIPTVINGAAHVCGFSGFEKGLKYPVVNLEAVQSALLDMSISLVGKVKGTKRWTVAEVILDPQKIFELI